MALKHQQVQRAQQQPLGRGDERISLPVIEENSSQFMSEKLKQIDEMRKNDELDPLEYIRLRKEYINSLIGEKPRLNIDEVEEPVEVIKPVPRTVRVAVIAKALFRKTSLHLPS